MNKPCCTGRCHQGRDCPYNDDVVPKVVQAIIATVLMILFLGVLLYEIDQDHGKTIDCTWAEINPDLTPKLREMCRRLRAVQ